MSVIPLKSQQQSKPLLTKNEINERSNSKFNYVKNTITDKYYKLLRYKQERMNDYNQNNKVNQFFALEKKDFERPNYNKKIKITDNQPFVYWKDYLLEYLYYEVEEGNFWASELAE